MAGTRGPKALPANIHLLQGNASKKAKSELIDTIRPEVNLPPPPAHLDAAAQAEWHRFGAELVRLRIVSDLDLAILEIYCVNYSLWVQANEKINALKEAALIDITPSGYKQMGVWLQIRNRASADLKSSAAEFGATPSARARVSPCNPQDDLFGFDGQANSNKKDPRRHIK